LNILPENLEWFTKEHLVILFDSAGTMNWQFRDTHDFTPLFSSKSNGADLLFVLFLFVGSLFRLEFTVQAMTRGLQFTATPCNRHTATR